MKHFGLIVAVIGSLFSASFAAPWVVLDSRNDMLAMSSEITNDNVAYAVPPPATTLGTISNDEAATTAASDIESAISEDSPVPTTEEQPQDDSEPLAEPELIPGEVSSGTDVQNVEQTTVKSSLDDIQQDIPEVTTMPSYSSSFSSMLEDDIQTEDMRIKVIPDTPVTPPRQNPNSIEGDEQLASVVVVSKKKHEIFNGKKSKFSM